MDSIHLHADEDTSETVNEQCANRGESSRPVRIGLVGCGRLAEFGYVPAFRRATGVTLVGVADTNVARCRAIAPGVPAYENIRSLIDAGGLEALVISTPTRFHLNDARCAAEANLPALVEKPPGIDATEATALCALRPAPWLAFNRRFEPGLVRLANKLPRSETLRLHLELHCRKKSWDPFDMRDDALLDLGPHLIDLARWLTASDVVRARARSVHECQAEFELELERGQATISCSNNSPYREGIVVTDDLGRVLGDYRRGGIVSGIVGRLRPNHEKPLVTSLVAQIEALGRAVGQRCYSSSLATTADGLAVMAAIEAVRSSAVHGHVQTRVNHLLQAH